MRLGLFAKCDLSYEIGKIFIISKKIIVVLNSLVMGRVVIE